MRAAAPAADPPAPDRSSLPAGSEPASRIVEFRRWACSEPDDPLAHFHLGTALADFGDAPAARRAFRCSLAALDRCRPALTGQALEGYDVDELRRLLVSRCGPGSGEVGGCSFEPRETST